MLSTLLSYVSLLVMSDNKEGSLVCIYAFALFSVADVVLVLVVSVVYGGG